MSYDAETERTHKPQSSQSGWSVARLSGSRLGRGENTPEAIRARLLSEIEKLEQQLARLQQGNSPRRFALMETYQTMITTRQELLDQVEQQSF